MAGGLVELLVRRARTGRLHLQPNFADDLALLKRSSQHVDKEAIQVDIAFAARANGAHNATQGQCYGRYVASRIGVRQRARQRALGAYLRIADFVGCFSQDGRALVNVL